MVTLAGAVLAFEPLEQLDRRVLGWVLFGIPQTFHPLGGRECFELQARLAEGWVQLFGVVESVGVQDVVDQASICSDIFGGFAQGSAANDTGKLQNGGGREVYGEPRDFL